MAEARTDLEAADHISLVGCTACPCGNIHVRMHDDDGAIYAVASMPPAIARVFLGELARLVEEAEAPGLGGIRCEGEA